MPIGKLFRELPCVIHLNAVDIFLASARTPNDVIARAVAVVTVTEINSCIKV